MHYLVFRRPSSPSSVSPNNIIFIVGGYVHFAPFLFHFSSQQQYSSLKCLVWSVEYHWCTSGVCIHWGITQYINYRTLHCSLCDGIKTLTFHCRTPLFSEGMYASLFRVFFFYVRVMQVAFKAGRVGTGSPSIKLRGRSDLFLCVPSCRSVWSKVMQVVWKPLPPSHSVQPDTYKHVELTHRAFPFCYFHDLMITDVTAIIVFYLKNKDRRIKQMCWRTIVTAVP